MQSIQAETRVLFIDFFQDICQHEGINANEISHEVRTASSEAENDEEIEELENFNFDDLRAGPNQENLRYLNANLLNEHGRLLKSCAQGYAESPERQNIRTLAEKFSVRSYEEFEVFLQEYFETNRLARPISNAERIATLYVFLSDVVIASYKDKKIIQAARIVLWSLQYISLKVCPWIRDIGGLAIIFGKKVWTFGSYSIVVSSLGVLAVAGIYLLKFR